MTDDDIISGVLAREGGFSNHPADAGGPTNFGITLYTLSQWRGKLCSVSDVMNLTETEARAIYRKYYLDDPHFDQIADGDLRAVVVDTAVNHGVDKAARWLQAAVGVQQDGTVGPVTLAAIAAAPVRKIRARFIAARCRAYGAIISSNPSQAVFASGWAHRLADFIEGLA